MITLTIRRYHIIMFVVLSIFTCGFLISHNVFASLSCSVSSTCTSPSVAVFRMSSTTNAHAELPNQSLYPNIVCCTGFTGLGNSCSGTYIVVARLSSTTNAHVEENDQNNYSQSACLSGPTGSNFSVGYQDNNCTGYDATLASIATPPTNSHVGDQNVYTKKICASAVQTGLTFVVDASSQSLTVTPGSFAATTSVLSAETNNPSGFNISVQKQATTTLALQSNPSIVIPDKTEFIAPSATTSAADTSSSSTEPYSLQFRLRKSDTDSGNFSSAWWGTDDTSSNALFAGFPTTTQKIVDRSIAAVATTTTTVLYDVGVDVNQINGVYSGTIVYSATVNP